jgi:hypothetical protein
VFVGKLREELDAFTGSCDTELKGFLDGACAALTAAGAEAGRVDAMRRPLEQALKVGRCRLTHMGGAGCPTLI